MLKLLIITQKVDARDPILGFFHRWLEEFSKNVEKLTIICLEKGEYNLPSNVKVLSLGKKKLEIRNWKLEILHRLIYLFRFYGHIWRERRSYDVVFVHMNPEYVILGWADWKIMGKKIALWYTHKAVNLKLRLAEKLADKIFTASRESFRLPSKKVEVVGHGIDTQKFTPSFDGVPGRMTGQFSNKLQIITAGRIAPVKNLETLIESFSILQNSKIDFEAKIAGGPATKSDEVYFEKLKSLVRQKGLENNVFFVGPIPYPRIQDFYHSGDIFVNLSETGSLDKAVLEAMSSGLLVITSNEAFHDILFPQFFLENKTPEVLAERIKKMSSENRPNLGLRELVVKNYGLEVLIKKIIALLVER
ncbi:MAG: glycosyltransferase family 4 protein [Candidatus Niyogibacteria bacterium]|nr:MAG: glycosyltransferase family 4 protein [Candidatus Niyogibacteria bacterium]